MLTPKFQLKQDGNFLTIIITAPFAKISETEIFIEGDDFKFFSKPYFLRLTLPGNIVEDGREKAEYNVDTGEFMAVFPKETPGEHFEGLDMITKLLAPKGKSSATGPLIQVIDASTTDDEKTKHTGDEDDINVACADDDNDNESEEEFDWRVEQTPYTEQPLLVGAPSYGFANQKSGVFARLQEDMVGIVDCPDPDELPVYERRVRRHEAEQSKFDEDHYLGDLYEDETIQRLIQYTPPWREVWEIVNNGTSVEIAVTLTEEEEDVMRKLPRKEYLLDSEEETGVYLGLVDILFAYVYNHRASEGENHCESGWTISKISTTLSWLDVFTSVEDVIVSGFRRALCYPLYRHWQLNKTILQDLIVLFKLGQRQILKCLLEIRSILMDQESRYVLNDLYITDYCVWIQSASSKRLQSLATALSKVNLCKKDMGFDLTEVERLACVAMESDDDDVDHVIDKLAGVSVQEHKTDDTYTESDDVMTHSDDVTTDSDDVTTDSDDVITDKDNTIEVADLKTLQLKSEKENYLTNKGLYECKKDDTFKQSKIQVLDSQNNDQCNATTQQDPSMMKQDNALLSCDESTKVDNLCNDVDKCQLEKS